MTAEQTNERSEAEIEVKTLEYNAKEGFRFVAFWWVFRRVLAPLLVVCVAWVILVFWRNGVWAGLLSAALFALPVLAIATFSKHQIGKIWEYWTK